MVCAFVGLPLSGADHPVSHCLRVEEFEQTRPAGGGVAAVAREMTSTITDPELQATEVGGASSLLIINLLVTGLTSGSSWIL